MSKLLKGTYKLKKARRKKPAKKGKTLSEEFESRTIEKLGGSIAFVEKPGLLWEGGDEEA